MNCPYCSGNTHDEHSSDCPINPNFMSPWNMIVNSFYGEPFMREWDKIKRFLQSLKKGE
jgi:hypothetical protein